MGSQEQTKSVKVTIYLRDGKTTELTEDIRSAGGDAANLNLLSKSLITLQTRTNEELTKIVDLEKASGQQQTAKSEQVDEDDEEDDEDEEEDEDKAEDAEPPKKQQKR